MNLGGKIKFEKFIVGYEYVSLAKEKCTRRDRSSTQACHFGINYEHCIHAKRVL